MKNHHNNHVPVLLDSVIKLLDPKPGETYLDLTAGYGGHAKAILERTGAEAVLVDRDPEAAKYLIKEFGNRAEVLNQDYAGALEHLKPRGFDLVLMDLGVSSAHLDRAERGFSFRASGPLDMRMDPTQAMSADTVINTFDADELAEIIAKYGEERQARRIAAAITANRPIKDTAELAELIRRLQPRRGGIDPATRTFQAIRIYVNDELGQLESALSALPDMIKPGGRWAVISFHSLEDRLVKRCFAELAAGGYDDEFVPLTKKPVFGHLMDESNPRSRSAKLRAVVKIKTKTRGH